MDTIVKNNLKNTDKNCAADHRQAKFEAFTDSRSVSNPIYQSRFQKLEKSLTELFLKELRAENSIFIKVDPGVIKKAALFLSKMVSRPVSIGVCGETASGKSTIVMDSMDTIENFSQEFLLENLVTRINTDDYYYDRSKEVISAGSFAEFTKNYDLDVPHAIELELMKKHIQMLLSNKEVYLPRYDMSGTAKRYENETLAKPCPIVVSEGLFTLVDGIEDAFDFKIYVDIEKSVQKRRFFERAQQRGLGDSAEGIFANASEKASIYIKPCAKNADIILNGEVSRERFKHFVSAFLMLIEEVHYNLTI